MAQSSQLRKDHRDGDTTGNKALPATGAPGAEGAALVHATLNSMPLLVWTSGGDTPASWNNSAWRHFTGTDASRWLDLVHGEDLARIKAQWQQSLRDGSAFEAELRLKNRSGEYRWLLVNALFPLSSVDPSGAWYLSGTDVNEVVTARNALTRNVRQQERMLDASVDCIKILKPDGTLVHMNHAGCRALGVSPDSGFGMKWLDLLPPEIHAPALRAFRQALRGSNARFSGKSVAPGKVAQHWDNILTPVLDARGKTASILCVSRDVTLQKQAEERLQQANAIDELTELPNRRAFKEQLGHMVAQARASNSNLLLMMADLDHFKHLNDTLGHGAGDHLLQVVARRIQGSLPEPAYVARMGGDEFAVLVPDVEDNDALHRLAHKVMTQLDPPIHFASKRINGNMSIGCALFPRDGRDPQLLLRNADAALNDMKASGRGSVRIFEDSIMQPLEEAVAQRELARQIVREGSVQPFYQPKYRLTDGKLVGLEALLRSDNADHGVQVPSMLTAAFRDFDLATRMADAMRARVFADLSDWLQAGLDVVPVSINAAPVEFMRDDYAERLLRQLDKAGMVPTLIELEVTEQTLEERGEIYVVRALKLLRQKGMRVALDDFGSGHSSLTRLRDFPADCLKIDSTLVAHYGRDPAITAVVNAVGQLGNNLSLELVAEGIETEHQRQLLVQAGFQFGQGHLFSEAVSAPAIAAMLPAGQAQPA